MPAATGHLPADCELPRKLDGYFFFWAFSAAFVTLPWVSLKVTLCGEINQSLNYIYITV